MLVCHSSYFVGCLAQKIKNKKIKKNKRVTLIRYSLHWYMGLVWFAGGIMASSSEVILDRGTFFYFERRVRALYDPFLHGSGRHFGSEVWVSFELGQLDHYPYHHSHLIIDLPQFGIFGMSGSSSSLITTLVSYLVFLLSSTSLFIFFYPHRSSSRFMNDMSFGVHHMLLSIVHLCVSRVALLT